MACGSRDIQAAHGSGGGGEAVGFDAELLEHGDVEVRQRVVALGVEGEVLAVPEAAAGEDDGQVGGDVAVGVAHVAAVEDHGAVDERLAVFRGGAEVGDELVEEAHVLVVDALELGDFLRVFPVVGQVVVALADGFPVHDDGRGADAVEHASGSVPNNRQLPVKPELL